MGFNRTWSSSIGGAVGAGADLGIVAAGLLSIDSAGCGEAALGGVDVVLAAALGGVDVVLAAAAGLSLLFLYLGHLLKI